MPAAGTVRQQCCCDRVPSVIARMFKGTCVVETFIGASAYGDQFAAEFTGKCDIDDGTKLVRDAQGNEVVSSSTVFAPIADVARYKPGSKVTVNDRSALVIAVHRRDNLGPTRIHHVQVDLT